jgi:uracil-DNA glycosylase
MNGPAYRKFVAAWLREIGIDYISVRRNPPPDVRSAAGGGRKRDGAEETLEDIRRDLERCDRCVLCGNAKSRIVFGVGSPDARLLFVGEAPGEEEDRQGEPFVGAAGKRLNRWIARIGLRREDVYITNIVKCRPPGNRVPLPDEAAACLPFLRRQIRVIRPEVICTLGATAVNYLLNVNERITKVRGRWREYEEFPVLPTYHPAFILRNQAREHEVLADFDRLAERLGLK